MRLIDARSFTADEPWAALDITSILDATARLHWTDTPYEWHVNTGSEAFVVLDGVVDMHYRRDGVEEVHRLVPGIIFVAESGDEHVAWPAPEARILVIEQRGST